MRVGWEGEGEDGGVNGVGASLISACSRIVLDGEGQPREGELLV